MKWTKMTSGIKSKIFNYGDEKESSWPPRFGTNDNKGGVFYIGDDGKIKEGYPPERNPKLAEAPQVIFDSIKPTYHEGACRVIETRKEWELADKQHNTLTFSSLEESKRHVAKGAFNEKKEYKADIQQAKEKAIKAYRENPKEIRARLNKQAEEQEKTLTKAEKKLLNKELKDTGIKYE